MSFDLSHISDRVACRDIALPTSPTPADYATRRLSRVEWETRVNAPLACDPVLDRVVKLECALGQVRRMSDSLMMAALSVEKTYVPAVRELLGPTTEDADAFEYVTVMSWHERCCRLASMLPGMPRSYWIAEFARSIGRARGQRRLALIGSLFAYLAREEEFAPLANLMKEFSDDCTNLCQGLPSAIFQPVSRGGQRFSKAQAELVSKALALSAFFEVTRKLTTAQADQAAFAKIKPQFEKLFGSRRYTIPSRGRWLNAGPLHAWRKRSGNSNLGAANMPPPPWSYADYLARALDSGDADDVAIAKMMTADL